MAADQEMADRLTDDVWTFARSTVLGLTADELPFSPYDAGITPENAKQAALARLTAIDAFRSLLSEHEAQVVHEARRAGATFVEMGEAVHITRQAARKRFA